MEDKGQEYFEKLKREDVQFNEFFSSPYIPESLKIKFAHRIKEADELSIPYNRSARRSRILSDSNRRIALRKEYAKQLGGLPKARKILPCFFE